MTYQHLVCLVMNVKVLVVDHGNRWVAEIMNEKIAMVAFVVYDQ